MPQFLWVIRDFTLQLLDESGVPVALHQSGALHYLGNVIQAQAATLGFQDGFMAPLGAILGPLWIPDQLGPPHDLKVCCFPPRTILRYVGFLECVVLKEI